MQASNIHSKKKKESACNARSAGDAGSVSGWGRPSGAGIGSPLQWRIPWTEEPGGQQS